MPAWGDILREAGSSDGKINTDAVRRKYLALLHRHTGRDTIIYSSAWMLQRRQGFYATEIVHEDMQGFMEAVHGLRSGSLDLILHSPGGTAEVAEGIVSYLRKKFEKIRVIVPQVAMSAATMLACSADEIVMGKHSSLGPIDPQVPVQSQHGVMMQPAQAIIENFEKAKETSQRYPGELGAYLPVLNQYYPGLIEKCHSAQNLATELVSEWLQRYMLGGSEGSGEKARMIAEELADHKKFKSHSRYIDGVAASKIGLKIVPLEDDQVLQDLVLSAFHATNISLQYGVNKIIENHLGRAFMKRITAS